MFKKKSTHSFVNVIMNVKAAFCWLLLEEGSIHMAPLLLPYNQYSMMSFGVVFFRMSEATEEVRGSMRHFRDTVNLETQK